MLYSNLFGNFDWQMSLSSTIWILRKYLVHLETYKSLHDEYDELQMLFENRWLTMLRPIKPFICLKLFNAFYSNAGVTKKVINSPWSKECILRGQIALNIITFIKLTGWNEVVDFILQKPDLLTFILLLSFNPMHPSFITFNLQACQKMYP